MSNPIKAFITYSHDDEQKRKKLRTRLAVMERNGEIKPRDDTDIAAGGKARQEDILKKVANSDILLYLVSADSLASKNCNKELTEAVKLGKRVIPIILENCDWMNDRFSNFQALPDKGKPINKWQPESDGWQNVVDGIRKAVGARQAQSNSSSETSEKELRAELAFQHGNVLMMIGQVDMAIERYSHAIELNPNNAAAYNNRGGAYYEKREYGRAIEDCNKAIQLKPDHPDSYNNRGMAYVKQKEYNRAIEDYNRAIDRKPDDASVYNNRGIALGGKGEFDRAINDFNKAIKFKPDYAIAHSCRGIAYREKGEFDRAIIDLNKAIELDPEEANPYYDRGLAYGKKGEVNLAIADFTKAIGLKPNHSDAYINRGTAYHQKGEYVQAVKDYTSTIELVPVHFEAYNNRGIAYYNESEYGQAIESFTKAIELKPDFADHYNNRGVTYNKKGDYDRAVEDFNKALELKRDYADAHNNRGNAYQSKGAHDQAIEDYNVAIVLKPDYADAYNNRGNAYQSKGNYDQAIEDYNTAIQLNPGLTQAYNNRGNAYRNKGKINHAIEDYTKAIQLKPSFADAYCGRAMAYINKGEIGRAIKDLNTTIKLKPNDADAFYNRGVAYGIKHEYDLAILDYDKAIEFRCDYVEAYCNRGITFCNKGEVDLAIADFNNAIQLKPDLAEAYINRGYAYGRKEGYSRAIEDYNRAINLKPTIAEAYNNRGVAYNKQGDYERAIMDYNTAIQLKPDYAEPYYNRGEAWLQQREWEKAREDLNTAKDKGVDVVAGLHNDYKSVKNFEKRHGVNLPADIADMLTQRRRSRYPKTEKFLSPDGTPYESPDVLILRARLRDAGTPLSQYVQTRPTFGIKTGASGAFVVDSVTREQLIAEHPTSADILKPFLHGRNIRRWAVEKPYSWLIFTCRRIEINRYPAIRKHLEKYRSALSNKKGKQKWYELPVAKHDAERFIQPKLICPNSYDHQTFAVDTDGFYCGDTCYVIPTEETWLCGLLNSRAVEWYYSQSSKQLTGDYLKARSRYMQQIPIPDLISTQKSLIGKIVDYLIYLQGQPTTNSEDLAHARDFIMLRYFERVIDGLVYESYLREELHRGDKHFFKPLLDERLPQLEEIRGDKMVELRAIFERLYERTHPVRRNLFFLDSVKPIRILEGKA